MKTNFQEIQKQIHIATALFKKGRRAAALHHFKRLRSLYPKSSEVWLESAFTFDRMSRETEAIPIYHRAIRLGLKGEALRDALVCLGSSLRTVGRSREAVRCLEKARTKFPDDPVVELFLALGYHDLSRPTRALQLAATACLRESARHRLAGFQSVLRRKYHTLGKRRKVGPVCKAD